MAGGALLRGRRQRRAGYASFAGSCGTEPSQADERLKAAVAAHEEGSGALQQEAAALLEQAGEAQEVRGQAGRWVGRWVQRPQGALAAAGWLGPCTGLRRPISRP